MVPAAHAGSHTGAVPLPLILRIKPAFEFERFRGNRRDGETGRVGKMGETVKRKCSCGTPVSTTVTALETEQVTSLYIKGRISNNNLCWVEFV